MNVASASLVTGLRTNVRKTRGEYWVLDIWSATSVMENTTPVNVRSAAAMVASRVRASSRLVGKSPSWNVKLWTYLDARSPATQAAMTATAGQSQSDSLRHSRKWARRAPPRTGTHPRTVVTGRPSAR